MGERPVSLVKAELKEDLELKPTVKATFRMEVSGSSGMRWTFFVAMLIAKNKVKFSA